MTARAAASVAPLLAVACGGGGGDEAPSVTLAITTLTDTRIAGTFELSANPASSSPTDARQPVAVAGGRFDLALRAP